MVEEISCENRDAVSDDDQGKWSQDMRIETSSNISLQEQSDRSPKSASRAMFKPEKFKRTDGDTGYLRRIKKDKEDECSNQCTKLDRKNPEEGMDGGNLHWKETAVAHGSAKGKQGRCGSQG